MRNPPGCCQFTCDRRLYRRHHRREPYKFGTARDMSATTRGINVGAVFGIRRAGTPIGPICSLYTGRFAAKNAALRVLMVKLRTKHACRASGSAVNLGGESHADYRTKEVDPQISPMMRRD